MPHPEEGYTPQYELNALGQLDDLGRRFFLSIPSGEEPDPDIGLSEMYVLFMAGIRGIARHLPGDTEAACYTLPWDEEGERAEGKAALALFEAKLAEHDPKRTLPVKLDVSISDRVLGGRLLYGIGVRPPSNYGCLVSILSCDNGPFVDWKPDPAYHRFHMQLGGTLEGELNRTDVTGVLGIQRYYPHDYTPHDPTNPDHTRSVDLLHRHLLLGALGLGIAGRSIRQRRTL